jgi:hypothetical protein
MADKSGIRFLKYYSQKLKSFFLSKDILSFLLFLALSAGFWFVHSLGKDRETTITIPVRYIGIPLNVAITNSPPTEIQLNVKDKGLQLLDYSKREHTPLCIDVHRTFNQKGEILITPDQLSGRINRYMRMQPTTTVLDIHPDSILLQYQKLSEKTLPVELVSKIELANQYMLSDKVLVEPSKVLVYGPKKMLDTMTVVRTEPVVLKNQKDTIYLNCKLKPIKKLRFSSNRIKLSVFVEPFTERKVVIPITAINCPANLSVRTFPAFVNVTYTVGLSHFRTLNPNDMQVFLDYNALEAGKLSKQKLIVKNNSTFISNIRISPEEVEFLLEEK